MCGSNHPVLNQLYNVGNHRYFVPKVRGIQVMNTPITANECRPSISRSIYERMIQEEDRDALPILADALDDEGFSELANAYRWAWKNSKWPFPRTEHKTQIVVYDWDLDHREVLAAPPHCRLPRELYNSMRVLKERRYGNIAQAFVLLANVLAGYKTYKELGAW